MKNRLYLCEIGDIYDNQIRLPYSTGLVWSYCKTFKEITDNYELLDWLFWREEVNQMLSRIKNPDIVGFSHFVWNEHTSVVVTDSPLIAISEHVEWNQFNFNTSPISIIFYFSWMFSYYFL